jgi:hypothetical protein
VARAQPLKLSHTRISLQAAHKTGVCRHNNCARLRPPASCSLTDEQKLKNHTFERMYLDTEARD